MGRATPKRGSTKSQKFVFPAAVVFRDPSGSATGEDDSDGGEDDSDDGDASGEDEE